MILSKIMEKINEATEVFFIIMKSRIRDNIFNYLNLYTLKQLSLTCKEIRKLVRNHYFDRYFISDKVSQEYRDKIKYVSISSGNISDYKSIISIKNSYDISNFQNLPPTLTHLSFSWSFNSKVDLRNLPLIYLRFRINFNQSVEDKLPLTLKYLNFGSKFKRFLDLSEFTLEHLRFGGGKFRSKLLPNTLTHLKLNIRFAFNHINLSRFENLTHLIFSCNFNSYIDFPIMEGVTHITFGICYNKSFRYKILPESLTHLTFGEQFSQKIDPGDLPKKLKYLKFGKKFNHHLDRNILPNITHLYLGEYFNKPIGDGINGGYLPDSIIHLHFDWRFNQDIGTLNISYLPNNLYDLSFRYFYKELTSASGDKYLPESLQWLEFPYTRKIQFGELPSKLQGLRIPRFSAKYEDIPDKFKGIVQFM